MTVVLRNVACLSAGKTRNLTIEICFTHERVDLIDIKILSANALQVKFQLLLLHKKKNSWSAF